MYSAKTILDLINNYKLDEAKAKLEANYREELILSGGKAKRGYNPLKLIEKMFKSGNQTDKRLVNTAHKQPNGEYHFINGYTIFTASESYGFREAEPHELLKTDKMFPKDCNLESSFTVNRKELDLFIKTKAHKPGKYDNRPYTIETENGIIGVNPEFLQTALDYCQSDTIRFDKIEEGKGLKSPIVIEGENVKALMLPVCIQDIDKELGYMKAWREEYKDVLSNI